MDEERRTTLIERRLRALAGQRVTWDSLALALFSVAMAGALFLLVVSLFWSGWVMALLLIPIGLLVWRLVMQNRFWHVAGLVEERFPEVRGRLVVEMQLAHWVGAKTGGRKSGTVPQSSSSDSLRYSPHFLRDSEPSVLICVHPWLPVPLLHSAF